ncbi:MAG: hypothetical protein IKM35_06380 [Bacteroidaceae bacterium]|mgnify:CR=1 FL=1|nr:hypothetical protein [Bacteroidaceae bacterium]
MGKRKFSTFNIICLTLLWVMLCYLVITKSELNFMTIFAIVASGIIVFVPIYKSKKRENDGR